LESYYESYTYDSDVYESVTAYRMEFNLGIMFASKLDVLIIPEMLKRANDEIALLHERYAALKESQILSLQSQADKVEPLQLELLSTQADLSSMYKREPRGADTLAVMTGKPSREVREMYRHLVAIGLLTEETHVSTSHTYKPTLEGMVHVDYIKNGKLHFLPSIRDYL